MMGIPVLATKQHLTDALAEPGLAFTRHSPADSRADGKRHRTVTWRRGLAFFLLVLAGAGRGGILPAQEYFENPRALESTNARFGRVLNVKNHLVSIYQDMTRLESMGSFTMGSIRIASRTAVEGAKFGPETILIADIPFYSNTPVPPVYSAALGKDNLVYLAYSEPEGQEVSILRFDPLQTPVQEAQKLGRIRSSQAVTSLKLYTRDDGTVLVLASRGTGNSYSIVASVSGDLKTWPEFQSVDKDLERNVNLNPAYTRLGDTDYLMFQSRDFRLMETLGVSTYQLYLKTSKDGGLTWSDGRLVTDFQDPGDNPGKNGFNAYDNQRSFLSSQGGDLVLLWERGLGKANRQVRYAHLDTSGKIKGEVLRISNTASGGFSPEWYLRGKEESVVWFSSQGQGTRVWLSRRTGPGSDFEARLMSEGLEEGAFPSLAWLDTGIFTLFHGRLSGSPKNTTRIFVVEPDTTASPPRFAALNFQPGTTNRQTSLQVRLDSAYDASGIQGFSATLSRNPKDDPGKVMKYEPGVVPVFPLLDKDGTWYVIARSLDLAGNWSAPAILQSTLDTTPPPPPRFTPLALDENGALVSNTFTLGWTAGDSSPVAGWQYSLQFLGQPENFDPWTFVDGLGSVPVMGTQDTTLLRRSNVENGWYLAAAWSQDAVGNQSKPAYLVFRADKFIPSTITSFLDLREDAFGNRSLDITGRGFLANGRIQRLVLDRDALPPWDYEYFANRGDYTIVSDREIRGLKLDNVNTASYLLGLDHTERGLDFTARRLELEKRGIIKYGDFTLNQPSQLSAQVFKPLQVQSGSLALWLALVLLVIIVPVAALQIRGVVRELELIDSTARAILGGKPGPLQLQARKVRKMKIQILGLRVKFTAFFLLLVIAVVLLISLPLSDYTLGNQKAVLAKGLQDRLQVMMESLVSSSANFLQTPEDYTIELRQLVNQGKAMNEVSYITITGQELGKPENVDAVWASSDPVILGTDKAAVPAAESGNPLLRRTINPVKYLPGRSTMKDSLSAWVADNQPLFDKTAREKLGTIPSDLASFSEQVKGLVLNTSAEAQAERQRIDGITAKLRETMNLTLEEIAGGMKSLPEYRPEKFDPTVENYIFYRPVYFRLAAEKPAEARYYRGMVRIGVSTTTIIQQIKSTQDEIIRNIMVFALIALASGLVGAIIMSTIIVIPIRRLVRGVERIRDIIGQEVEKQDTLYSEFLHDSPIKLKSRDELATLGTSISDMVYSLKKGAETNKDLGAGKLIQKMFIPLDKVGKGKGTVGRSKNTHTEIFGYYEGAKGVSGDYFDFQKISRNLWASIKCDISGKGIPAALIMVEVATLFLHHFDGWEGREAERKLKRKMHGDEGDLVPLVKSINDLVAGREFGSKFAAFNIAIFNEETGECTFCNAGDNQVHIYRDLPKEVESLTISKTPAAGMFSSDMFPPAMRYKEDHAMLEFGDILLMFTDGVEESQIYYRTQDMQLSSATQADIDAGDVPSYCQPGRIDEEFGLERIKAVVAAAQNKGKYTLQRSRKTAFSDTVTTFDFSGLGNTAEETVLALVCVEKIFRMIPDPKATEKDRIKVDKVVDDFMKRVFDQYHKFFAYPREDFKDDLYREYTHLKEESQFDDLTLLAIKKL